MSIDEAESFAGDSEGGGARGGRAGAEATAHSGFPTSLLMRRWRCALCACVRACGGPAAGRALVAAGAPVSFAQSSREPALSLTCASKPMGYYWADRTR